MSKLYLECYSGISGDMFVASLLDLGADAEYLQKVLGTVPAEGFRVQISRVKKAGLDVCDFDVILDEAHENHDHDMEYLFGQEQGHEHHHDHEHHNHHHDGHHHEHHHHEHRGMREVLEIIEGTQMTERAKETAARIFTILGQAEAKAHGTTLEEVHFHEVGAVDSIVDIIAAAVCLDNLNITETVIPVLYEGCGSIRCQHGILPVPVPAVANIVQANGLALHMTDTKGELVTPTGAAIAAAIRTEDRLPEEFTVERIGIGAGKRAYEKPSLLRAMLLRSEDEEEKNCDGKTDVIWKLESNIDDCSGECLGHVMDRLLEAGARDVHYTPVYMKKNRPAWQLNVICSETDVSRLEEMIFRETTTIGIRKMRMERRILERESREVETSCGTARIKICRIPSAESEESEVRIYPEYSSVEELCRRTGRSFPEIFRLIQEESYGQM